MRRRTALMFLAPIAALSLIGAGCGGGSTKTSGGSSASSDDPAAILGAVKTGDQTKPQKVSMDLGVTLDGQINDPRASAFLGTGPITVKLSGPVDPTTKSMDMVVDLKAGKLVLPAKLRVIEGTSAFIGLQDKWYAIPSDSLKTSTTQVAADPAETLKALGNPADLLDNAKVVGGETIEGIDTDHVSGDLNLDKLAEAMQRISKSTPDPAAQADALAKLKEAVKSGKVDVWVGKDDKIVHRIKLDMGIAIPAESQQTSMGIKGAQVALTVQTTPLASVSVTAPSNPLTTTELQNDIMQVVLANLGSATPTP